MDGMFCDACEPDNNGCTATQPTMECHVPARPAETEGSSTDGFSTGVMPTTTSSGDTVDGSSSTSNGSSTTGSNPCVSNDDCNEAGAPFCDPASGECVTCAATDDPDGSCAGLDPAAPLCVNETCVQCTPASSGVCDEQLLLCDAASNACVPCTEHGQCGSGACVLAAGTCFPPGDVVHVDGDGGQDFLDVVTAVASVGVGEHRVIVVHELDGGLPYLGGAVIDQGKTVALLAASGEQPIIQGIGVDPGIRILGVGTTLYADRLEISNAATTGVVVDGTYAWFDRSRIVGNDGGGVLAQDLGHITLRNCFVGGNIDTNVLDIQASTADILYTTLGASLGTTTSITCDALAMATVRNSLIVSRSEEAEVACANLDATQTAAETMLPGTGNVGLGTMDTGWFQGFNAGDFHLAKAPFTIATTAQWRIGDPPIDIDGDDRPDTDGATDVAGADRP